jgi:menaquinone-dependent protoporphyrinogen oxidase
MRVLVAYGSKMGGTTGIAQLVGDALADAGFQADVRPATQVADLSPYDAVIIGGALYSGHWHRGARRFVKRHTGTLRERPVWLSSSGPLNGSAAEEIPPVPQVQELLARIGARGHVTFGGRLPANATGFPASAMAKTHAGDWRDPERVRGWAAEVAMKLLRLTSWGSRMPNRLTRPGNGWRPPKGELWP